jgi:pyrroline-5-carboxylate reductase
MNTLPSQTIGFIGAGNMASAIIGGLIQQGFPAKHIWAADPYPASLEKLQTVADVNIHQNNNEVIAHADIIVLAVKPQQMKAVCADIKSSISIKKPLIISIAAGITCTMLEQWIDKSAALVRCMPNTPALVQTAASGLFANSHVSAHQRTSAESLLNAIGISHWVAEESLLDAVTALSGSGPAYFFMLMELMIEAGQKLGLDADTAKALTLQTALGAAKMAIASDVDTKELRRRVTSPNGTTEAAINSFEADKLGAIVERALTAADIRSKSLAEEMLQG